MTAMYGGTILRINLSEGKISKEPTSAYSADFLGGRGINTKILYDGAPPEIGALDPASPLIFGVGPLSGTPVPSGRVEITYKSPETGFLGSTGFGGFFGPELKFAGYDHLVFTGKADKPIYLWIYNDQVEIRDAANMWGKSTYETQEIIHTEINPEARVACIGPAGENLVHFATVQSELGHGAGRTGAGCVMGSKNLKAIVARGTSGIDLADPVKYLSLAEEVQQKLRNHPGAQEIRKYSLNRFIDAMGEHRAEQTGVIRRKTQLYDLNLKFKPKRAGCFGCPTQCMDLYPVEAAGGGVTSCGNSAFPVTSLENHGLDKSLEFSLSTQKYGMDTVSSIKILDWLVDLHSRGIITAKDTDGIPMEQANPDAFIGMLKKIVYREGFGDILANGLAPAAEKIGRGSQDYADHMKGLPLYEPGTHESLIGSKGNALSMVMSSRGDTMRARAETLVEEHDTIQFFREADEKTAAEGIAANLAKIKKITGTEKAVLPGEYEGKPELVAYTEDVIAIGDCLGACKLTGSFNISGFPFDETYQAALFSAGSGIETSVDTLFKAAGKVRTLERAFCVREGMTRETDSLPKRFMDKPVEEGHFKGEMLESAKFEAMKDKYYALRGWDVATGIPSRKALEEAGLGDVAKDLEKRGKLTVPSAKGSKK